MAAVSSSSSSSNAFLPPALSEDPQLKKLEGILTKWKQECNNREDIVTISDDLHERFKLRVPELNLSRYPDLRKLPDEALSLFTHLEVIRLENLERCEIPKCLTALTKLTLLAIVRCACDPDLFPSPQTPLPLSTLTNLHIFSLCFTNHPIVPPEIVHLTGLEDLYMVGQGIGCIPAAMGALTTLTYIDLSTNAIEYPPPELGQLVKLRTLNLYGNPVRKIPPEYGKLTNLGGLQDFDCCRVLPLSVSVLPKREYKLDELLNFWEECAGQKLPCDHIDYAAQGGTELAQWLLELARSPEYMSCQPQVAQKVFNMLRVLPYDSRFRLNFFEVLRESRPVQSQELLFDELDVLLQNMTLYRDEPLKTKYAELEGVARTIALRNLMENSTKGYSQERKLRKIHNTEAMNCERLNLRKAILQRDDTAEFHLHRTLDGEHLKFLVTLASFKILAQDNEKFLTQVKKIETDYETRRVKDNVPESVLAHIKNAALMDIYINSINELD